MTVIERTIAITSKDADGNTTIDMPITKVENVEGALTETEIDTKISNAVANLPTDGTGDVDLSNYVDLTSEQSITGTKAFGTIDVNKINCSSMLDLYASGQAQLTAKKIRWMLGTTQAGAITATQYTGNSASATKATNDSAGNKIVDTYATLADTYTKTEVDDLISSVEGGGDSSESSYGWVELTNTSAYSTIDGGEDFPYTVHCFDLTTLGNVKKVHIYSSVMDMEENDGCLMAITPIEPYELEDISLLQEDMFQTAHPYRYTAYARDYNQPVGATIEITYFPSPYLYFVDFANHEGSYPVVRTVFALVETEV